jgi:hypothetical protein
VSFSADARRVRDTGLPTGRRWTALRCAVSCYCPMGYRSTWAFLETTGDLRTDEGALLRALERLELSRSAWLAEERAFAARRREEKRLTHRRTPTAAELLLRRGHRWPGPEGHQAMFGAVAALWAAHTAVPASGRGAEDAELAELDAVVGDAVSGCLRAGGVLDGRGAWLLRRALPRLGATVVRCGRASRASVDFGHARRLAKVTELVLGDG